MQVTTKATETCDFQLTDACKTRNGIAYATEGYVTTTVEGRVKFVCDDCSRWVLRGR